MLKRFDSSLSGGKQTNRAQNPNTGAYFLLLLKFWGGGNCPPPECAHALTAISFLKIINKTNKVKKVKVSIKWAWKDINAFKVFISESEEHKQTTV